MQDDERVHRSTVFTSSLGIGLNCFSAVLSVLSSIALMIALFRSTTRLRSVYHRLMLGIALSTFVSALSMAFATLPMPQDMIYTQFEGIIAGTTATCDAQYFFIALGSATYWMYIFSITVYFTSCITFNTSEDTFKKCIEKFLHFISIVIPVFVTGIVVGNGFANPAPYFAPYCTASRYPYWCEDEQACYLREVGKTSSSWEFRLVYLPLLKSSFLYLSIFMSAIVILCFAMLVISVLKKESKIKAMRNDYDITNTLDVLLEKNMLDTRAVFLQSLSYLLAYGIRVGFIMKRGAAYDSLFHATRGFQIASCLINPADGFLMSLIYFSTEVYNLKRSEVFQQGYKRPTLLRAIRTILNGSPNSPTVSVISNLFMVMNDALAPEDAVANVVSSDDSNSQFSDAEDCADISYPSNNPSSVGFSHNVSFDLNSETRMDGEDDTENRGMAIQCSSREKSENLTFNDDDLNLLKSFTDFNVPKELNLDPGKSSKDTFMRNKKTLLRKCRDADLPIHYPTVTK